VVLDFGVQVLLGVTWPCLLVLPVFNGELAYPYV